MEIKGRVIVYSITACPHCKAAKSKLESLGLPYDDINLEDHPEQRDVMKTFSDRQTVPQIFFNEKHIGGNDDFQALSSEELNDLIAYVRDNPAPENAPQPVKNMVQAERNDINSDEMDEMASLVEDIRVNSGIIHNHRHFLFLSHPRTFTGEDLVSYVAKKQNSDRDVALEVASRLIEKKFAVSIKDNLPMQDDKTLYRLVQDLQSKALNAGMPAYQSLNAASDLSVHIRKSILNLYNKFLSSDGKAVDYDGLGQSEEFEDYIKLTAQLQRVQLDNLTREELLAFFINIYNALVIHGNIKIGFPSTTYQRYKFFNDAKYVIGGLEYSLQSIENGVLRSNRKGVGMLSRPFKKTDPRLKFILDPHEPLIHFALVCGAKSCPPIKTYSSENIMNELKLSASAFLESDDGCCIDKEEGLIGLSMIFKWYKEDFGETPNEVLKWVKTYMSEGEKKQQLSDLLDTKLYNLLYLTYDWGTNKLSKN